MVQRFDEPSVFTDYGFSSFRFEPNDIAKSAYMSVGPTTHTHLEIEMVLVERGHVTYSFAGRDELVPPRQLTAFWGGLPHGIADVDPATIFYVAQVPIVDTMAWLGAAGVFDRLLRGHFLRVPSGGEEGRCDRWQFNRWTQDLATRDASLRKAAELEVQARLRRLVRWHLPSDPGPLAHAHLDTAQRVGEAIAFVVRQFMEPLTVKEIAHAVGWQRDHLMESFRKICGMTLWEYVVRVRIAEAERLLAGTDLPIAAVGRRAGFGSTSRLYDAFNRYAGQTPASYRASTRR